MTEVRSPGPIPKSEHLKVFSEFSEHADVPDSDDSEGFGRFGRESCAVRNYNTAAAVQADRAAIETLLRARTQAQPLLTPKDLLRILQWPADKLRTVQRHLRAIRSEK